MKKLDYKHLVNKYLEDGGKVTRLEESKTRFKTWRGKAGAYNRGAKKINLRDKGIA